MSDLLLSWLRAQIESDKAKAVRVIGTWREDGPGTGVIVTSNGHHAEECANALWSGIADHIVTHDPRDTIARCEAELALLDEMIPIIEELDDIAYSEGLGSFPHGYPVPRLIELLAAGYKHRPGYGSWEMA